MKYDDLKQVIKSNKLNEEKKEGKTGAPIVWTPGSKDNGFEFCDGRTVSAPAKGEENPQQ